MMPKYPVKRKEINTLTLTLTFTGEKRVKTMVISVT